MPTPSKKVNVHSNELATCAARTSLKSRLGAVHHFLPLAAEKWKESDEYVHQVRVWSRRSQSTIEVYRCVLPRLKTAWIENKLKQIRKNTNDARDDDVFLQRLLESKPDDELGSLIKRVRRHRQRSHRRFFRWYEQLEDKHKFARRTNKLIARIRFRELGSFEEEPTLGEFAPCILAPMLNDWMSKAKADMSDIEELHRFRIVGKRLRYALELLAPALPEREGDGLISLLTDIQTSLGTINDHASAADRLKKWIDSGDDSSNRFLHRSRTKEKRLLRREHKQFVLTWSTQRQKEAARLCRRIAKGCVSTKTKH